MLGLSTLLATVPTLGRPAASPQSWAQPSALHSDCALLGGTMWLRSPASQAVLFPRTAFAMGSTPREVLEAAALCGREPLNELCSVERFANELPQRTVRLGPYWIDRFEVTVAQYRRCSDLQVCAPAFYGGGAQRFDQPAYPVTMVSWSDARRYCRFAGSRLPTEAEWEQAARGVARRRYPWGMLYNSRASNHGRLGILRTDGSDGYLELAPVGAFPQGRTPSGVLDLAGNVSEWVLDRYAPSYEGQPAVDPQGPRAGTARVVRGGDYLSPAAWIRGTSRVNVRPGTRAPHIGFRCARSLSR